EGRASSPRRRALRSRGAPRLRRGASERRGVWGAISGPPSKQADYSVQLGVGIHEIHPLGDDPQAVRGASQAMLDLGAPDPLSLVAILDQDERGADAKLMVIRVEHPDVADLVHGAGRRDARVSARMQELTDADLEQGAVVVHDRHRRDWIRLARLE